MHRNFDSVVTWSKAGPSMQSVCTSDEMVSGWKPLASMARAVLNANEPLPWPMSNFTPRFRASSTSVLHRALLGGRRVGERPEGVGQHVARPQPLAAPPRSSAADGRCGTSAACRPRWPPASAMSSGTMPELPEAPRPTRTLMPTIDVAVGVGHLHGADRVHQPQLLALAHHHAVGEGVDAGVRDVQVGEDAHLAAARSRACGSRRSCRGRRCRCRSRW